MVAAPPLRPVYSLTDSTPARTIWVYRNGDAYYLGRKFVINHRYVPNFEAFMIQLNEGVPTPFGVRNVYTPRQGHSVMDLADFQQGGRYVVAGRERFKKLNYFNIGARKPQARKRDEVIRPVVHSNIQVPSKWQSIYNKPRNIHVFTNGDTLIQPMKILIPKFTLKNWNSVLGLINEKVVPRSGGIHRLYTLKGRPVYGPDDLEDNQYYVGCGREKFKALPYWRNPKVPADVRRYYSKSSLDPSKPEKKFQISRPKPRESYAPEDVAFLRPPFAEPSKPRRELEQGRGDVPSVYLAKSKKASPETTPTALSSDDGRSVYKAGRRRTETEGATDIPEDKNVQVDVPVEQAPAEIVHDEDIYYNGGTVEVKDPTEIDRDEDLYSNAEIVQGKVSAEGAHDEDVYSTVENAEKKEQKRTSSFKKWFGFLFPSKKKDREELKIETASVMALSDSKTNDANDISSPTPLVCSRCQSLEVLQKVSTSTDNLESDGVTGGTDTVAAKEENIEEFEIETRNGYQQTNYTESDNLKSDEVMGGTDTVEAKEENIEEFEIETRNGHQRTNRTESVSVPQHKKGAQQKIGD